MHEQSLAERFRGGAIPLAQALEYFAGLAHTLRELHAEGRKHGRVNADHVTLTAAGVELRAPEGSPGPYDYTDDAMALGALIFQVLTGTRPMPGGSPPLVPRMSGPRSNPENIRATALQIALRAYTHAPDAEPEWAKYAAELRLLAMLARQARRRPGSREVPLRKVEAPIPQKEAPPDPAPTASALPSGPAQEGKAPPPEQRIEPAVPAAFLRRDVPSAPAAPIDPDLPDYRRCPECDSADVHSSKPRTRMEKLGNLALRIPLFRCHQCYHRWFLIFRVAIPCKVQKVQRRTF